jgi:hypothetical protein
MPRSRRQEYGEGSGAPASQEKSAGRKAKGGERAVKGSARRRDILQISPEDLGFHHEGVLDRLDTGDLDSAGGGLPEEHPLRFIAGDRNLARAVARSDYKSIVFAEFPIPPYPTESAAAYRAFKIYCFSFYKRLPENMPRYKYVAIEFLKQVKNDIAFYNCDLEVDISAKVESHLRTTVRWYENYFWAYRGRFFKQWMESHVPIWESIYRQRSYIRELEEFYEAFIEQWKRLRQMNESFQGILSTLLPQVKYDETIEPVWMTQLSQGEISNETLSKTGAMMGHLSKLAYAIRQNNDSNEVAKRNFLEAIGLNKVFELMIDQIDRDCIRAGAGASFLPNDILPSIVESERDDRFDENGFPHAHEERDISEIQAELEYLDPAEVFND